MAGVLLLPCTVPLKENRFSDPRQDREHGANLIAHHGAVHLSSDIYPSILDLLSIYSANTFSSTNAERK